MIYMTEAEFVGLRNDENIGICLSCNNEQDGCEPDARKYKCDDCGKQTVYGLEELLIMGEIDIVAKEEVEGKRKEEQEKRRKREAEKRQTRRREGDK